MQSVQSACWAALVSQEKNKQTWMMTGNMTMGKRCPTVNHKERSWETKSKHWETFLPLTLQERKVLNNCSAFKVTEVCGFWSAPAQSHGNCTHVESATHKIALQVELWVGIWKISNLFQCIKENKWTQPWSSPPKCHEQHHLHSASPWTQRSAMLNCFTDAQIDRLTGSLLQS